MSSGLISIIVPNYNNGRYLYDCLLSVAEQTYPEFECIVIDDGSTDDSVKTIKQFVKKDKRFKLIEQANAGVGCARNAGLDIAQGEYITFLDSDDCFTDVALESMIHAAKKYKADIVGGATSSVPENFKYVRNQNSKIDFKSMQPLATFDGNDAVIRSYGIAPEKFGEGYKPVWLWRQLFHRDVIGDRRFVPGLCPGDDICYSLDIYRFGTRNVLIRAPITYHRMSATSVMNNGLKKSLVSFFAPALEYIYNEIRPNYSPEFMDGFYRGFALYLYDYTVRKPVKEKQFCDVAAIALDEVRRHEWFPWKYFTRFQRFIIRFLIFIYLPKGGRKNETKN